MTSLPLVTIWLSYDDKKKNSLPGLPQLPLKIFSFVFVTRRGSYTVDYNKGYLLTQSIMFVPRGDKVFSSDSIPFGTYIT